MTAWHRHTLDPVHTVHPTASPYDTTARTALAQQPTQVRATGRASNRAGAIARPQRSQVP